MLVHLVRVRWCGASAELCSKHAVLRRVRLNTQDRQHTVRYVGLIAIISSRATPAKRDHCKICSDQFYSAILLRNAAPHNAAPHSVSLFSAIWMHFFEYFISFIYLSKIYVV